MDALRAATACPAGRPERGRVIRKAPRFSSGVTKLTSVRATKRAGRNEYEICGGRYHLVGMIDARIRQLGVAGPSMDWSEVLIKWTSAAALYLFWPAVALIVWGELTPHPPEWTAHIWDKVLHFTAYFGLASMATLVLGMRRRTLWALLGLAVLGGILEVLQGFTGRDPDILDELANCLGVALGFSTAWGFLAVLKSRVLIPATD
jgi:VanZ family protein